MKKLNVEQMENLQGGTNRQCLIAGVLTVIGGAVGTAAGGPWWGAAGVIGGISNATSMGCFG